MKNVIITPGGKDIIQEAEELFGKNKVQGGIFRDPVNINGLSDLEADQAYFWFTEQGKKVQIIDVVEKS